jgi:hypothetical protein
MCVLYQVMILVFRTNIVSRPFQKIKILDSMLSIRSIFYHLIIHYVINSL